MKIALIVAFVLLLPVMMAAQTDTGRTPQAHPPSASLGTTTPGFRFPGGFNPPAGLFEQFWNDPTVAGELHLTDAQRKQLRDAALAQRLALIDSGADALKALAHLSALLDADQLDDAAYKQQLNSLAAAAGKLVQDAGEMAASARRVLTLEQWQKLRTLQRAKQAEARSPAPASPAPPAGSAP